MVNIQRIGTPGLGVILCYCFSSCAWSYEGAYGDCGESVKADEGSVEYLKTYVIHFSSQTIEQSVVDYGQFEVPEDI